MKKVEEIVERTVRDTHVHYEAIDGTTFTDEQECIKYEGTVEAVLLAKVKEFELKEIPGNDFFESNDEGVYRVVVPTTNEHIDVLNQLWFLNGGAKNKEPLFSTEDINTLILVGIRWCMASTDWVWFWKVEKVIEKITDNKFALSRVKLTLKGS